MSFIALTPLRYLHPPKGLFEKSPFGNRKILAQKTWVRKTLAQKTLAT